MSLTVGTGPFGHRPTGRFDFEPPAEVVFVEPFPRRVRSLAGGETVVDSTEAVLLHETGSLPVLYFPESDVRLEALAAGAVERHAAAPGYVSIRWSSVESWLEEDEPMYGHVRDPYHRVEIRRSSRHVRVSLAGDLLAESRRPVVLYETALPPRYYLPRADVRAELLPHEKRTVCAYKGEAAHWSVRAAAGIAEAVAWTYDEPDDDARKVAGLVAFYNEWVDLDVDGESVERPRTQWHPAGWAGRAA